MNLKFTKVNDEIIKEMVEMLSAKKAAQLENALQRNYLLTTTYDLPFVSLEVYKEGYLLAASGTRCEWRVFFKDEDGELKELERKPRALNLLYTTISHRSIQDYRG